MVIPSFPKPRGRFRRWNSRYSRRPSSSAQPSSPVATCIPAFIIAGTGAIPDERWRFDEALTAILVLERAMRSSSCVLARTQWASVSRSDRRPIASSISTMPVEKRPVRPFALRRRLQQVHVDPTAGLARGGSHPGQKLVRTPLHSRRTVLHIDLPRHVGHRLGHARNLCDLLVRGRHGRQPRGFDKCAGPGIESVEQRGMVAVDPRVSIPQCHGKADRDTGVMGGAGDFAHLDLDRGSPHRPGQVDHHGGHPALDRVREGGCGGRIGIGRGHRGQLWQRGLERFQPDPEGRGRERPRVVVRIGQCRHGQQPRRRIVGGADCGDAAVLDPEFDGAEGSYRSPRRAQQIAMVLLVIEGSRLVATRNGL